MTIVYFDCFSGIAGDMILGALLDIGMSIDTFKTEIEKLHLTGYSINCQRVEQHHISACDIEIKETEPQPNRSFKDIKNVITKSVLSETIKKESILIFQRLAEVEGKIHNINPSEVHFHEIGAIDSIIDIVGSVIALHYYKISKIYSSPLPLGTGFVTCAHGKLPIPAPATLELVKNIPVYQTNRKQELVTPTGAAIIASFTSTFGPMPQMNIKKIGYGSGKTKSEYPNLIRIIVGELDKTKRK